MKIFVDDSGSFGWNPPGVSLFCAVSAPDKNLPDLFVRFLRWKQTVTKKRKGTEVKGKTLTDDQMISFIRDVLKRDKPLFLTVVGGDTSRMDAAIVDLHKKQSVEVFHATAKLAYERKKPILAREYSEMAGWLLKRSIQNYLWVACLENTIHTAEQHTIARFLEPEFDSEFENLEIVIDESFIRRREHLKYWKEWLRNGLLKLSRERPMMIPSDWAARKHPYIRKYRSRPGGGCPLIRRK